MEGGNIIISRQEHSSRSASRGIAFCNLRQPTMVGVCKIKRGTENDDKQTSTMEAIEGCGHPLRLLYRVKVIM